MFLVLTLPLQSIWADMALTVGEYLYKRMVPAATGTVPMNICDMVVEQAQIVMSNREGAQLLQVEAEMDLEDLATAVRWYNVDDVGNRHQEPYATATVRYENPKDWAAEFSRMSWLVDGRVQALTAMVRGGSASRLGRGLAYALFGNVVDYSDRYRGMHSVVSHGLEAYADVILAPERHGTWHTPPHWIDSLFHVGGFVMNGIEASHTKDYFYVTNGWSSCRIMAKLAALAGGADSTTSYQSYVRMAPASEANMFSGDVYILQDGAIVGMMGGMRFRRIHRILMDRFFSPPDTAVGAGGVAKVTTSRAKDATSSTPTVKPKATPLRLKPKSVANRTVPAATRSAVEQAAPGQAAGDEEKEQEAGGEAAPMGMGDSVSGQPAEGIVGDALKLIAKETGLGLSDLTDEATFVELGVDSLTSLVLAEKFKQELSIEVKSSLFLECLNVGDLKGWMEQNA